MASLNSRSTVRLWARRQPPKMSLRSRLRSRVARRLHVPEIGTALERLGRLGFTPNLIFDVGAYKGDFARECLTVWKDTQIACFEPLPHCVTELKQLADGFPTIQVFPGLLGAEPSDSIAFHEAETASSVLAEKVPQGFPVNSYPMRTIDEVVQNNFDGRCPDLLKIDVQGYELEIIKGAKKSLQGMKAILSEVNLLDVHQDVALVGEVVIWLNHRGWVAYDICGLHRRPLDDALWQIDILFVPVESPLRSDKRWNV